jgi:hypothetical protein
VAGAAAGVAPRRAARAGTNKRAVRMLKKRMVSMRDKKEQTVEDVFGLWKYFTSIL